MMRRSFGGGGGGSSGGMRTVQRAVRAGGVGGATPEPFSATSATNTRKPTTTNLSKKKSSQQQHPNAPLLTLSSVPSSSTSSGSSAFSSLVNLPYYYSGGSGVATPTLTDVDEDMEWECVDGGEEEGKAKVFYEEDLVFGSVPSTDEVTHAVSALQLALGPTLYANLPKEDFAEDSDNYSAYEVTSPVSLEKRISSDDSETDWVEPSLYLYNSRRSTTRGSDRVYDAFHLLQTEPSVQRMVISLSSDKAVWDAVLNNELVKELRSSIEADNQRLERESTGEDSDDSNPIKDLMSWVFVNAKAKIMQLIDDISKLMNGVFQSPNVDNKGGTSVFLEETLKTSLFLSVVVLLIVVVSRAQSA